MRRCSHFAVGFVQGQDVICCFESLLRYCYSTARIYWIGTGETPKKEILKILKCFEGFKYCPKCGAKLDFEKIKERL